MCHVPQMTRKHVEATPSQFCRMIAPISICTGGTPVSTLDTALFVLYTVSCINRPSLLALSVSKHALQFEDLLAGNQHSGFP